MYDSLLNDVLTEYYEKEFLKYPGAPEHKFSFRHRRAMKKIFKLYEKNTECLRPKPSPMPSPAPAAVHKVRLTPRSAFILVLIIFLGVLVGCTALYFVSQDFRGDIYSEYTRVFPINKENCPTVIEEKYYLSELPEGYEIAETDSTPFTEYTYYENKSTGQMISFVQEAKPEYGSINHNTENHKIEEVEINGHCGLCIDFSNDELFHSSVIWDNDDYILELSADLPKKEMLDLAKSAKLLEK